jgi:hypothetical protein
VYVYIYLFPLIPVERACKAFVNPTAEKVFWMHKKWQPCSGPVYHAQSSGHQLL